MGEGTNGLTTPSAAQIEHEVHVIRDNVTGIVRELDRPRHALTDWRLQLRRHDKAVRIVAGSMLIVLGGLLALGVYKRRRRERPVTRMQHFGGALARVLEEPKTIARPAPTIGRKVLAAAASGAASVLIKLLTRRMLGPGTAGERMA